jgi:hypothetical protein
VSLEYFKSAAGVKFCRFAWFFLFQHPQHSAGSAASIFSPQLGAKLDS